MPIPSTMADLSLTAANNSPQGTDSIGNTLDDYLRSIQAILRSTNALSPASIASAATTDIGSAAAESVEITGTTTITSFGNSPAGIRRELRFAGSLTITHSSSIQLPGAKNWQTAAGDVLTFRSLGSGQWIMTGHQSLDASRLTGTLSDDRLSSNIARRSGGNSFTGGQIITHTGSHLTFFNSGDPDKAVLELNNGSLTLFGYDASVSEWHPFLKGTVDSGAVTIGEANRSVHVPGSLNVNGNAEFQSLGTSGTVTLRGTSAFSNASNRIFSSIRTDAAQNTGRWRFQHTQTGLISFATENDAGESVSNALGFSRSGTAVTNLIFGNATDNPSYVFQGNGAMRSGGVIQVANGTASVPAYSFEADSNTGIYRPSAGGVSVSVDGVDVALFSSVDLRVTGDVQAGGGFRFKNDTNFYIYNTSAVTYGSWRIGGARNGYCGLVLDIGGKPTFMGNASGTFGVYDQSAGRWSWQDTGSAFLVNNRIKDLFSGLPYIFHASNGMASGRVFVQQGGSPAGTQEGDITIIW